MRTVIFLVDMNAFFISCETTRNPELAGLPAAVAGDPKNRTGIILAASYEARAFGVRTAMVVRDAKNCCPDLKLVPPDHEFYQSASRRVMELLAEFTPVLEQASVDEAWLDMTGSESLFGPPEQAAKTTQEAIRTRLGLPCSIGISDNKVLAKMAADMKKPMGITELWTSDIEEKLWPHPVRDLYGIGKKTCERLNRMGVMTIGDLARCDPVLLTRMFGVTGRMLQLRASGSERDPVAPRSESGAKSIGRSVTLPEDIDRAEKAKAILLDLADDVGRSVRRLGRRGHTVQLTLRYADFKTVTRQMNIPASDTTQDLYHAACTLLQDNWSRNRPVRLIGLRLSGFKEAAGQLSLFDSADEPTGTGRDRQIDEAMDRIRERHGKTSIQRGSLLKNHKPKSEAPSDEK